MTLDEVISYNRLFADMETKSGDLEIAEYYRDTVKCLEELKELREQISEYKRLLKSATNVLKRFKPCDGDYDCSECIHQRQNCDYDDRFKWRFADEALKLIES